MANKGLRSYTKNLQQSLSCGAGVSINLNSNDRNTITHLPLTNVMNKCPFSFGLIYNNLTTGLPSYFGSKTCLDGLIYLSVLNTVAKVYFSDGTYDELEIDGEVYKSDTSDYEVKYDNEGSKWIIKDKYNNKFHVNPAINGYPYLIEIDGGM